MSYTVHEHYTPKEDPIVYEVGSSYGAMMHARATFTKHPYAAVAVRHQYTDWTGQLVSQELYRLSSDTHRITGSGEIYAYDTDPLPEL